MHHRTGYGESPAVTTHSIVAKNSPAAKKSIFPVDHHYKRDKNFCKTVYRTLKTSNKLNYESFYCEQFSLDCTDAIFAFTVFSSFNKANLGASMQHLLFSVGRTERKPAESTPKCTLSILTKKELTTCDIKTIR